MNNLSKILAGACFITTLSSCAFIFYNYRAKLVTEYSIKNTTKDTTIRIRVAEMINRLAAGQDFYRRYTSPASDSVYFYGPDYHHLRFKLSETDTSTKIVFDYFGYHGFKKRPPRKRFIAALRDSLKIQFNAKETVLTDFSNEKKKKK